MPHESPSNNEPEGSKDGRQWTNAEIFAFVGFLNDERNDGALQNTTTKFVARVVSPRPLRKFIGHQIPRLFKSWSHELRGSVL
ncbi:hypothetical protein E4U12_007145 [Claviceps purpurea]|nr:hypothetical protein E4U12_007145 [Claviceps purpurea]